jgi:cytochrome oxidase assembly protein ShyY1
MPIRFRFSWMPFIATAVVVAIGIALGNWQVRRAHEKEAIEASLQTRDAQAAIILNANGTYEPEAVEYRRVHVKGSFIREWPLYLDNRPYERRAGFYMLMPFRIAGSDRTVLVARGWLPRDPTDRARLPAVPTPAGEVEIEGSIRLHPPRVYQFGAAAPLRAGAIVQNITVDEVAGATGLKLLPFMIEQGSTMAAAYDDGLVRDWPLPSLGVDKHRGYALQWYGLAAAAGIFFIVTGFRRGRNK